MKTVYIVCLIILCLIITLAIFIVVINRFENFISSNKKKPNNTGKYYFYNELNKLINDKEYIIKNLIIPYNDEKIELESVLISRKGVFSIITRSWDEAIKGNAKDEYFLVSGENKKNPIKINEKNRIALLSLLNNEYDIREITFIKSLNNVNFMHESLYDLNSFLNEYSLNYPQILSYDEINKIYNELLKYKVTTDEIIALRKEKSENVL